MSFSKIFYNNFFQKYVQDVIPLGRDSLNSMILKRKRKLIKKMKYQQALQVPETKYFRKYIDSNANDLFFKQIWIKANLIDFYHDALFLYEYTISSFCTEQTCSLMSVGPSRIYLWPIGKDQDEIDEDTNLTSAGYYISQSFKWIYLILNDRNSLIPNSLEEIDNGTLIKKKIVNRLFRFYGHCYYDHLEEIKRDEALHSFYILTLRFFISFSLKYDLLDAFEFEPMKMIVFPFNDITENLEEDSYSEKIEEPSNFSASEPEDK